MTPVPPFAYTTGNPDNLVGGQPAAMTDVQGPFYDLRAYLNATLLPGISPVRAVALPGSPTDGQEIYYVADAAAGVLWHLRYNAASASAYKWECLGGPPIVSEVAAQVAAPLAAFGDMAGGPSLTVPLAGDYDIRYGAGMWATANGEVDIALKIGAAAVPFGEYVRVRSFNPPAEVETNGFTNVRRNVAAAATVVKLQIRGQVVAGVAYNRVLTMTPVRVG